MPGRSGVRAIATLLGYVCAVVWLTWPLGAHLATDLPNTYPLARCDALFGGWALAWETHALTTDAWRLFDANIFHPAKHTLAYGPLAFGGLPFFAPVFLTTGNPTLALNLTLLLGIALTATGLHRVTVRWTGLELAGFIAGWAFLCVRWTLYSSLPTVPYYAALQWLPWIVWLSASSLQGPTRVLGLAALVTFQGLTDAVYVAPATLAPLGVLAVIRLARPATRAAGIRLAAALGIALLALVPVYAAYLLVVAAEPNLLASTIWTASTASLERIGIPSVAGMAMVPQPAPWHGAANAGPIGLPRAALALIVVGVALRIARRGGDDRARPGWRMATLWAVVGLAISVPAIGNLGDAIVMPHFALAAHVAPRLLEIVRAPWRLGVAGLVGLALLAGLAMAEVARRAGRWSRLVGPVVAGLVVVLGYVEVRGYEPSPYQLAPAITDEDAQVIEWLRAGSGPVLEVPVLQEGTRPAPNSSAMYRSIFHWRPLLNGYSSYIPTGYAVRMAIANDLPDPAALATLRRETDLTTIVVHDAADLPNRAAWQRAATDPTGPLVLVGRAGATSVFDVR